jgi:acetyl-CoA synthetase
MSDWSPRDGNFNIGSICTTHVCEAGRADAVAMRWISDRFERTDYTFGELDRESDRFANALSGLGYRPGDVFFTFLPRMPEQFFAFLGALKAQVVCGTLFSNFGEEALLDRLGDAKARGIVTKKSLLKRLAGIRGKLPALEHVVVVDAEPGDGLLSYRELTAAAGDRFEVAATPPDTPSVLHYTSGSTGKPKGVLHRHGAVLHQRRTTEEVLGLSQADTFWCTADPGWVTGTTYGIIGPWSLGVTQLHYGGGYDADAWFRLLEEQGVTVWYSAPTALRMLMREDPSLFAKRDLAGLRSIFSVGEPLNPEAIAWSRRVLGREVHDTWFQTETGAIMIANRPGLEVRPGSMGLPVRGAEAAIVGDDGVVLPDGEQGNLCLRAGWDSMFVAYLNHEEVYRQKFRKGWYHTGDTALRDEDGYYWFKGRSDDVINTAGHLVSPFEVESALLEMPEVAESGVIGAPDEMLYEKVVAFVHLKEGVEWTRWLELKIRLHLSNKVSTLATPQEFVIVGSIPKNKSGKIMRRVLKARYLGEDAGDTSTLEI